MGSKYKVQPKKVEVELLEKDSKFLHLKLMETERCWSYAMQLKAEANTELRKKFSMISRLRKACNYADELKKLCESDLCDARTKLESEAYASWMKGSLLFELQNWKGSMEGFASAKTIYEKLAHMLTEDIQALYHQRVEEISANIRYCDYNIGDKTAVNDLMEMKLHSGGDLTSRIDELLVQTREKQTATMSEITWRGKVIPVKNEKVRLFLLNVNDSDKELESAPDFESKLSVYASLLNECIDAQQVLRDELKNDPTFKQTQRGQKIEGKIPKLQLLHSYVSYIRYMKQVERNLLIIDSLEQALATGKAVEGKKVPKPQDIVRLFDIIVQSLAEIPNLPGLEGEEKLEKELGVQGMGYKAFRCFYIAQTYSSLQKWPEALALYERTLENSKEAIEGYKSLKEIQTKNGRDEVKKLEELIRTVDGLKYSCQASSILGMEEASDLMANLSIRPKKPLVDRLEEFVEDPNLLGKKPNIVNFPPDFQPIPCKPLFFDLALNHVEFPSLEDKLEQKKGSGLTGFVKGWLWGGKS